MYTFVYTEKIQVFHELSICVFFFSVLSNSYYNENPKSLGKERIKYTTYRQNTVPAIRGKLTNPEICTVQ